MNTPRKHPLELKEELEKAKQKVEVGALYAHYKGEDKIYKVLNLAFNEADTKLCVVYQAQYDEKLSFVRPLEVWLESVDWKGSTVPRFMKLIKEQ